MSDSQCRRAASDEPATPSRCRWSGPARSPARWPTAPAPAAPPNHRPMTTPAATAAAKSTRLHHADPISVTGADADDRASLGGLRAAPLPGCDGVLYVAGELSDIPASTQNLHRCSSR